MTTTQNDAVTPADLSFSVNGDTAAKLRSQMDAILEKAKERGNGLYASESRQFDKLEAQLQQVQDVNREVAERQRKLDEMTSQFMAPARVTSEPEVYSGRAGSPSFFRDMYSARQGNFEAMERLHRNNQYRQTYSNRALNTTAGAAGEFAPPGWLESQFVALARPGRIAADLLHKEDLPQGVDSVNIPKISTGTQVAIQGTQNTPIQQTDLTSTAVASPIVTLAGGETLSVQLLDQSPINVDTVITQDLAADYARCLNQLVLASTANPEGLTVAAGTTIPFTTTTPTGAQFLSKAAGAIAAVTSSRYAPPTHIVMTPTRWAWLCAQVDNNGRPLVTPQDGAFESIGVGDPVPGTNGLVGRMLGLPVYADPSLPTNLGSGNNQDQVLIMRADDSWLFEGNLMAEAFPQTYAPNLSIFVRIYSYAALVHRYAQSIAVISGTGLVQPTF